MKPRFDLLREWWRRLYGNVRLRRLVSAVVLLFTMGFLIALLIRGYSQLRQFSNWRAYLTVCGQGFLLYPLSLALQASIWRLMIARVGRVSGGWRDVEIYAYTYLMRNLPGAMWYLAGRTVMYRERGIGAGVTLAASSMEWLLLLAAAVSVYSSLSLAALSLWLLGLLIFPLLLGLILLAPRILRSVPDRYWPPGVVRRWLTGISASAVPPNRDLALWLSLYVIAYVIGGLILFLLTHGVMPESSITVIDAIRIWALTGGIGFLVTMFVPAGLGVRELTLTALLAPYVPDVGALLVALLLRMLFIASDLVWGGLMWAIARVLGSRQ